MTNHKSMLDALLANDVDDAIVKAAILPPSRRARFLVFILSNACEENQNLLVAAKCLSMAKSLLASSSSSLSDDEYLHWLEKSISLSSSLDDPSTQLQALSVASLITSRLGRLVRYCSDATRTQIADLAKQSKSETACRLATRLNNIIESAVVLAQKAAITRRRSFDVGTLDVDLARENVLDDAENDWYEDPWGWPELKWMGNTVIEQRLRAAEHGWTLALDVPKRGGGVRPALLLSAEDRIAYQAIADELSLVATSDLPDWVFGWRARRNDPKKGRYSDNGEEWKKFTKRVQEHGRKFRFALRIDIRSFFETINTHCLLRDIGCNYRKTGILDRLESFFDHWHIQRNGLGIPQRSLASSILAHVPLRSIDSYLTQVSRRDSRRVSPLRWMDDIWLFGSSEDALWSTVSEIESLLDDQGLGLNSSKTELLEAESAVSNVFHFPSGDEEVDSEAMVNQLEDLLDRIDEAPRSALSYLTRFRGKGADHIDEQLSKTFTQASLDEFEVSADHVATFLQRADGWKQKVDWYRRHVNRHVAAESWTVPTWGRMFPVCAEPSAEQQAVSNLFVDRFEHGIQRSLVPLAAHRLANWHVTNAKDVLMEFLSEESFSPHQFSIRAACFAALTCGVAKKDIRAIAANAPEPMLLEMIKNANLKNYGIIP